MRRWALTPPKKSLKSLSDNTMARRINDIETVVLKKIHVSKKFALQLDESTDISGHSQLLANVRFVDGDVIREKARHCQKKQQERKFFGSRRNILTKEDLRGKTVHVFALKEQQPCAPVRKGLPLRTVFYTVRLSLQKPYQQI